MTDKLTPKQQRFVEAYCGEAKGNATEAARLAGYAGNDVTLRAVAHENLTKPHIAATIAAFRAECREGSKRNREALLDRLWATGTGEPIFNGEAAPPGTQVSALVAVLKAEGWNEPAKVEVSGAAERPPISITVEEATALLRAMKQREKTDG